MFTIIKGGLHQHRLALI